MSSSSLLTSLGAALQNFSSPRFSFRGTSSPTARTNANLNASGFESELASQIEELKSVDDGGYLAIPWLCRAMEVVVRTLTSLRTSLPDLQQGLSEGENRWLDDYLDDSVKLLDVCNALRDAIDDLKNYCVLIELALHAMGTDMSDVDALDSNAITYSRLLGPGNFSEARLLRAKMGISKCSDTLKKRDEEAIQKRSKLETCSSMLRRMGEKMSTEDSTKGNLFVSIYASQVMTIIICGVLTAALSFKARRPLSTIAVAGQSAWSFALSSLQQRVKDQVEKKKSKGVCALLEELENTDITVKCLQDLVSELLNVKVFPVSGEQAVEMRQLSKSLQDCARELSQGLALLELHIKDVYKALILSRMSLLDIYGCHL